MTSCFTCVAHGIDDVVEDFYRQLNLEPWHVFANRHRAENVKNDMRDPERQTGRTTHGLLEIFAICVTRGTKGVQLRPQLKNMARNLISQLRLDLEVTSLRAGYLYEDHYHG